MTDVCMPQPPLPIPPAGLTREFVEARIALVEKMRTTWVGNPGYLKVLELDVYALRLVLEEMI